MNVLLEYPPWLAVPNAVCKPLSYKHIQVRSEKLLMSLQMEQGKKPLFEPLVPALMVLLSCSHVIPGDCRGICRESFTWPLFYSHGSSVRRGVWSKTHVNWPIAMCTQAVVSLTSVTTGALQDWGLNIFSLLRAAKGQNTSIGWLYITAGFGDLLQAWGDTFASQTRREWEKEGIKINSGSSRITRWNNDRSFWVEENL